MFSNQYIIFGAVMLANDIHAEILHSGDYFKDYPDTLITNGKGQCIPDSFSEIKSLEGIELLAGDILVTVNDGMYVAQRIL